MKFCLYFSSLQDKLKPDNEAEFKASITAAFKQAVAMFDDLTFYQSEYLFFILIVLLILISFEKKYILALAFHKGVMAQKQTKQ